MALLDTRRPVLVLTRETVRPYLANVTVAPITTTIRGLSTELPVGTGNGLNDECVASLDHVQTIPARDLGDRMGWLLPAQEHDLSRAFRPPSTSTERGGRAQSRILRTRCVSGQVSSKGLDFCWQWWDVGRVVQHDGSSGTKIMRSVASNDRLSIPIAAVRTYDGGFPMKTRLATIAAGTALAASASVLVAVPTSATGHVTGGGTMRIPATVACATGVRNAPESTAKTTLVAALGAAQTTLRAETKAADDAKRATVSAARTTLTAELKAAGSNQAARDAAYAKFQAAVANAEGTATAARTAAVGKAAAATETAYAAYFAATATPAEQAARTACFAAVKAAQTQYKSAMDASRAKFNAAIAGPLATLKTELRAAKTRAAVRAAYTKYQAAVAPAYATYRTETTAAQKAYRTAVDTAKKTLKAALALP